MEITGQEVRAIREPRPEGQVGTGGVAGPSAPAPEWQPWPPSAHVCMVTAASPWPGPPSSPSGEGPPRKPPCPAQPSPSPQTLTPSVSQRGGRSVGPQPQPLSLKRVGGIAHLDPPLIAAQGPVGHQPRIQHLLQEAAQLLGIVPWPGARGLNEDVEGAFWKGRGRESRGRRSGEGWGGTARARGLQRLPTHRGHPQSSHRLLWVKNRSSTVRQPVPLETRQSRTAGAGPCREGQGSSHQTAG